jgi:hypothetical protein
MHSGSQPTRSRIAASIGGVADALMESAVEVNKSVFTDQHSTRHPSSEHR